MEDSRIIDFGKSEPETPATPTCEDCGKPFPYLHRHHKIARSQGGTDDPSNIERICPNCHVMRHGGTFGGNLRGTRKRRTSTNKGEPKARTGDELKTLEIRLPKWHIKLLGTIAAYNGTSVEDAVAKILENDFEGKRDDHPVAVRELQRHQALCRSLVEEMYPLVGLLTAVLADSMEELDKPLNDRDVLLKGLKFSLSEWAGIQGLLGELGITFPELVKSALTEYASAHRASINPEESD